MDFFDTAIIPIVQKGKCMFENIPEISSIEGRVRYLSQFVGGINALAERIGISPRQLGNYLRGKAPWPSRRIMAIAVVTGVDLTWIQDGTGDIPRPEPAVRPKRKGSAPPDANVGNEPSISFRQDRAVEFAAQLRTYTTRISTILLAQADLSNLVQEISEPVLKAYMQGEAAPCEAHLDVIAKCLHLKRDWIMGA